MKKIATWLFATVGGVVLLFTYRTSTEAVSPSAEPHAAAAAATTAPAEAAPAASPTTTAPATTDAATPNPSPTAEQQAPAATGLRDGTYTGASQDTKYGPVQVQITVAGGQVTTATAVAFPTGTARADEINADAIPRLQTESVGTVDGQIDMITGATFTSTGYLGSLQEAIDQARP